MSVMDKDDKRRDGELTEAIAVLACELNRLREQRKFEFDWFKAHLELATKQDLKATERRILEAIDAPGPGLSQDDVKVLNGVLERAGQQAARIEALDAKTP